ncbi:MAG: transcription termination factor Rho [Clostridia bacterium]|nr:transcription termination factor Rho [Clostridia bacterium]
MDLQDLKKKKIDDLRYIGKMLGIKSMSKMSKQALIDAILDVEKTSPAVETREEDSVQQEKVKAESEETAEVKAEEKPDSEAKADVITDSEGDIEAKEPAKKKEKHKKKNRADAVKEKRSKRGAASKKNNTEESENAEQAEKQEEKQEDKQEENTEEKIEEKREEAKVQDNTEEVEGLLDILAEGYGFLRVGKYLSGNKDIYVPPTLIRKFSLKTGDKIKGRSKMQRENDKYPALCFINTINDDPIEVALKRKPFESLVPIYPDEKIRLETESNELSTRLIDLIAPIGKGQRGMIVSPPKAGKTVLLKKIANAITTNYPDIHLIVLLIDERPEEVTDMRESVQGDVISSTFDEMPEKHIKVSEMVFERSKRLVEQGKDVVILMDSLTRLARAYNITIAPTGRSLSGGLDPGALYNPKRFFGAARNIRGGGSLTIVATALIDTGSKMDDVIFEEFKGTGNMELHLDRKLSEKRVFPAIDINKSGTRKEELLLSEKELNSVFSIRRAMSNLGTGDVTEIIVSKMLKTKNNEEFINTIKILPPDGAKN